MKITMEGENGRIASVMFEEAGAFVVAEEFRNLMVAYGYACESAREAVPDCEDCKICDECDERAKCDECAKGHDLCAEGGDG